MNIARTSPALKPGQIAYFVHLHQNTAQKTDEPSHKEKTFFYKVEGKARPMLVLDCLPPEYGARWYRVLRFTTKPPANSNKKMYFSVEKRIDPKKDSYLIKEPICCPDNLHRYDLEPPAQQFDQQEMKNVYKVLHLHLFKSTETK